MTYYRLHPKHISQHYNYHFTHLTLPRVRNNYGKRRFAYRAADMYNQLVITNSHSNLAMPVFKAKIRELLRSRRSGE